MSLVKENSDLLNFVFDFDLEVNNKLDKEEKKLIERNYASKINQNGFKNPFYNIQLKETGIELLDEINKLRFQIYLEGGDPDCMESLMSKKQTLEVSKTQISGKINISKNKIELDINLGLLNDSIKLKTTNQLKLFNNFDKNIAESIVLVKNISNLF